MLIASIPSLPSLPPVSQAGGGASAGGATAVGGAGGNSFSSVLGNAVTSLQHTQNAATAAEAQAAAGQGSLTDTMIKAAEASVQTQVVTAVIDKGLAAYNSIANMTF